MDVNKDQVYGFLRLVGMFALGSLVTSGKLKPEQASQLMTFGAEAWPYVAAFAVAAYSWWKRRNAGLVASVASIPQEAKAAAVAQLPVEQQKALVASAPADVQIASVASMPEVRKVVVNNNASNGVGKAAADPMLPNVVSQAVDNQDVKDKRP